MIEAVIGFLLGVVFELAVMYLVYRVGYWDGFRALHEPEDPCDICNALRQGER